MARKTPGAETKFAKSAVESFSFFGCGSAALGLCGSVGPSSSPPHSQTPENRLNQAMISLMISP